MTHVLPGLAGMGVAVACLWWSWFYPARLVGPGWYRTSMSRVFLFLIPAMSLLGLFVATDAVLAGFGLPLPDAVFDAGAVILFAGLLLALVGTAGVPLPAPWAPRWMRERRELERR